MGAAISVPRLEQVANVAIGGERQALFRDRPATADAIIPKRLILLCHITSRLGASLKLLFRIGGID